jgi:hypothetical protein
VKDKLAYGEVNWQFHRALYVACQHPRTSNLIETLWRNASGIQCCCGTALPTSGNPNPRLQARVLPTRSEMVVTTLVAQIVRFARPNIQIYDARVVDLYQWVRAPYRVRVKGAETKLSFNG